MRWCDLQGSVSNFFPHKTSGRHSHYPTWQQQQVKNERSDINCFYLRTWVTTLPFGPRWTRPPLERKVRTQSFNRAIPYPFLPPLSPEMPTHHSKCTSPNECDCINRITSPSPLKCISSQTVFQGELHWKAYFRHNYTEANFVESQGIVLNVCTIGARMMTLRRHLSSHLHVPFGHHALPAPGVCWVRSGSQDEAGGSCFYPQTFTRPCILQQQCVKNRGYCCHRNCPRIMPCLFSDWAVLVTNTSYQHVQNAQSATKAWHVNCKHRKAFYKVLWVFDINTRYSF